MSLATPVRETREVLIQRARDAMRMAEAETLPHRARIHLAAAERWIDLADRKLKRDETASADTTHAGGISPGL
jgi:hypothetical protein